MQTGRRQLRKPVMDQLKNFEKEYFKHKYL
jgi:hypothetical protein